MRTRNFLVASICAVLLTGGFHVAIAYEKAREKANRGDLLWISEETKIKNFLNLRFTDEDFLRAQDPPEEKMAQFFHTSWNGHFEFDGPLCPRIARPIKISGAENSKIFFISPKRSFEEVEANTRYTLLNEDQKAVLSGSKKNPGEPHGDWKGIGRDTAFFLGYQGVFAGVLYFLPESVTSWTKEQKKTTVGKWGENVRNPVWDSDKWWINYIGHPYFGATYYIRARERGFGEFGSFCYSALLSGMYEFGIEAFFEPPSYQDLIVTPAGGYLLGKFVFEPIREKIKAKPQLRWYDHLTLILTDPLGALNSVFERLLGIKSDIRVQFRLPALPRGDRSSYDRAGFPPGQEVIHPQRQDAGLEFHMEWK